MKRGYSFLIMLCILLFFSNCYNPEPMDNNDYSKDDNSFNFSMSKQSNIEKMVMCPYCGGTGRWCDPTDFMAQFPCNFCNRTGQVTESQARDIIEASRQVQMMMSSGGFTQGVYSQSSRSNGRQCYDCYGSGKCSRCGGRGEHNVSNMYGGGIIQYDCEYCHGSGRCQTCFGSGTI